MDRELTEQLRLAQSGDLEAFGYVVTACRAPALRIAGSLTRDRHLAEDAVQEAFVVALDRLDTLREPAAFLGWLQAIVRTCVHRAQRRKRPDRLDAGWDAQGDAPEPSAHAERTEACALVRDAVRSLTPQTRALIERYYLDGASVAEIADALGVPRGTVKRRLFDARQTLNLRLLGARPPAPSVRPRSTPLNRPLR